MKKTLPVIIAFAVIISVTIINRVSADFTKAKEELKVQLENYNQVHREYQTAKAKYQQFKTLPTETEAFLAVRRVLAARTQVMQAYFVLIAEKLTETGSVPNDTRSSLNSEIEGQKSYLTDFRKRALGAANLQEAENLSDEFEAKLEGWQNIITKYQGVIFTSALINIAERQTSLIEKTSQTLAATHAITNITDLNLREEKIEFAKNKTTETVDLAQKSREKFLTISAETRKSEVNSIEQVAAKEANKAKEAAIAAITAIKEAARDL